MTPLVRSVTHVPWMSSAFQQYLSWIKGFDLFLTLLHLERPKLYGVLAVLSAVG